MNRTEALTLARQTLDAHGLHGWKAVIDTRPRKRLGQCRYRNREIGISAYHVTYHSDEDVRDTILHEIAHALVGPGHGHGPVWKAKARALGIRPRASVEVKMNNAGNMLAVQRAAARAAARTTVKPVTAPIWVAGSSDWDAMFNA